MDTVKLDKPADVYVVLTSDNDPHFATFSMERGEFARYEDAHTLATELAEMGETAHIEAREWVPHNGRGIMGYRETRRLAGKVVEVERAAIESIWRATHGHTEARSLVASDAEWRFMVNLLRAQSPRKGY